MFIVIEGVDGSGKETQTGLLCRKISNARRIEFPNYNSNSSALVKMYLAGEFGSKPGDVSAYAASVFFACDRYASWKSDWHSDLDNGKTVIADRYVSSNLIHQMCKIDDPAERDRFMTWLLDFEYNIMGIPKPDVTIFLDMPVESALELMKNRNNKITGNEQKDIHENDVAYLKKAYNSAVSVCEKSDWHRVRCVKDGKIRTPEEISEEVFSVVSQFMKG